MPDGRPGLCAADARYLKLTWGGGRGLGIAVKVEEAGRGSRQWLAVKFLRCRGASMSQQAVPAAASADLPIRGDTVGRSACVLHTQHAG
jgi:hypothetical protein